jgi:hypothetical protein
MNLGAKFLQCGVEAASMRGERSLIVHHTNSVICKVMLVVALFIESFD